MKLILFLAAIALTGCSTVRLKTKEGFELSHTSFAKKETIGKVAITPGKDGLPPTFTLSGYDADASQVAAAMMAAGFNAGVEAAKRAP